uniref:Putative secreted protein n=1 Tax=Anopheles triannulatus TaxID=58253 RepID=A0A2M4B5V8_9DIPT
MLRQASALVGAAVGIAPPISRTISCEAGNPEGSPAAYRCDPPVRPTILSKSWERPRLPLVSTLEDRNAPRCDDVIEEG